MVLSTTSGKSNAPGVYAPGMAMTITGGEQVLGEELPQHTGISALPTNVYVVAASKQVNPTTASQFIVLQGTINGAEDTSGSGVSFDISSLGEATETYIRAKNALFALPWRILVNPDLQPLWKLIGTPTLITWSTPVEINSIISSKTTTAEMPAILKDEELSPEDREAREKGLQLVAHIERQMQTDEGFRTWFQEGFDEIAAGHFITFSEDGWKEE